MKRPFFSLCLLATTSIALAASSLFTTTATVAIHYLHHTGTQAAITVECVHVYQNDTIAVVNTRIESGDPFYVVVYETYRKGSWRVLDANSTPAGAGITPLTHLGISKSTAQQILAGNTPCIH